MFKEVEMALELIGRARPEELVSCPPGLLLKVKRLLNGVSSNSPAFASTREAAPEGLFADTSGAGELLVNFTYLLLSQPENRAATLQVSVCSIIETREALYHTLDNTKNLRKNKCQSKTVKIVSYLIKHKDCISSFLASSPY